MTIYSAGPPGTELDREKGKKISFSISNILSKEQQQQQQQRQHSEHTEQSDIEESEEEEGSDEDSEPPDPEDVKQRLAGGGGGVDPLGQLGGLAGLPAGVSLSDPLKSYLSAAYSTSLAGVSHDLLSGSSSPLVGGPGEQGGAVIKVPAHRPPSLPLPLDYTAAPWLYRPPLSGLPSYLPLPSSLLLNRFGVGGEAEPSTFISRFIKLNYLSSSISSSTHWPSISEQNSAKEEKAENVFLPVTNLRT